MKLLSDNAVALNRLFDELDDRVSELAHLEMEVVEARRKYAQVKDKIRNFAEGIGNASTSQS
jgi:hypothetical protein